MHAITLALIGTAIAFSGTAIGSAFVFFTKESLGDKTQKLFLGFASGVMIAASVWSLLLPAAEYSVQLGLPEWLPLASGFLLGAGLLFIIDRLRLEEHGTKRKTSKLILAVTLHNFPEGMAVGLAFALAGKADSSVSIAAATALAVGVAVQNIPEGAIISLPLLAEGYSKRRAFMYGTLSGIVEPFAGVLGAIITAITLSLIPWVLSFAAGAMIYVVIDELIPSAASENTRLGTVGAIAGFVLMMLLDVALS